MDKSHQFVDNQQIKTMTEVLSKMGKFFSDIAEQSLKQLSDKDAIIERTKLEANREKLTLLENPPKLDKSLDKSKVKQIEDEELKKNLTMLENVKNHKPKHPVSSFFSFYREKGQQIAKERGEVLGSKIAKIVGELWKNMSEAEKEPYEIKSKVARQKYEEEMIEYRLNYSDEIVALKKYKQQLKTKKKLKPIPTEKLFKIDSQIPQKKELILPQLKTAEKQIPSSSDNLDDEEDDFDDMDMSDPLSDSMSADSSSSEQLPQPIIQLSNLQIQPLKTQQNTKISGQVKKDLKDMSLNDMSLDDLLYNQDEERLNLGQFKVDINQKDMELEGKEEYSMEESPEVETVPRIQSRTAAMNSIGDTKPLKVVQPIKPKIKPSPLPMQDLSLNSQSNEIQNHISQLQAAQQTVPKPKGPISSFILFYRTKGKQISEANKIPLGPKVIKIASEIWHKLPFEQKEFYAKGAKQIRQNYYKQIADLKSKYGDDVFNKQKVQKSSKKMKIKK